jgi:hypothetical protein
VGVAGGLRQSVGKPAARSVLEHLVTENFSDHLLGFDVEIWGVQERVREPLVLYMFSLSILLLITSAGVWSGQRHVGTLRARRVGCMGILWWSFNDQQSRCRECMHRLVLPTRIGDPGCLLLSWAGMELVCEKATAFCTSPKPITAAGWNIGDGPNSTIRGKASSSVPSHTMQQRMQPRSGPYFPSPQPEQHVGLSVFKHQSRYQLSQRRTMLEPMA